LPTANYATGSDGKMHVLPIDAHLLRVNAAMKETCPDSEAE